MGATRLRARFPSWQRLRAAFFTESLVSHSVVPGASGGNGLTATDMQGDASAVIWPTSPS
jgi:hypothetical protein